MKRLDNVTVKVLFLIVSSVMLSSCYTYKEVFNDKYNVEEDKVGVLVEKLEVGDWIYVRVNGKKYGNLQVTGITDQILSVSMWNSEGVASYYPLYIPYIQKLELRVQDPMYTLGAGYTALLLIFFLLV